MKIQDYINDRNKYKVDETYQRPNNAWSNDDKQCLIDTILKEEPLPLFFLNYKSDENVYYIVDGQQRLSCITDFYDNKIKLNEKYSGKSQSGKNFNGNNSLSDSDKKNFLNYDLKFHVLEDYNDERVRLIFARLQRGRPLSLGERLNAKPGKIVECMRLLANHSFMAESIGVAKGRYGTFPDSARILFYEKYGAKQAGTEEIYKFFDDFSDLDNKSNEFKSAISVLNFLESCFPKKPGDYKHLEKHAWVLAVYTMIKNLKQEYSIIGQEDKIGSFIKGFHGKVYDQTFRKSKSNYQIFYDNIRGGWSEKIIAIRRDILIYEFLLINPLNSLAIKRQISNTQKIAVFRKNNSCQKCNIPFKDYKDAEYHHKDRYADGGKSEIENIMILCTNCHDEIHREPKSEIQTNNESTT